MIFIYLNYVFQELSSYEEDFCENSPKPEQKNSQEEITRAALVG